MSIETGGWHTLRCESCGREERKEVVYGFPDSELFERAARGDVVLAGCCIGASLGEWYCSTCSLALEEREGAELQDAAPED